VTAITTATATVTAIVTVAVTIAVISTLIVTVKNREEIGRIVDLGLRPRTISHSNFGTFECYPVFSYPRDTIYMVLC
jgi:hypothetical protein